MLENNATYIGSSAGAMIAGIDVRLALDFDRDTEDLDDYRALSLFNIIYSKNSPSSTGERWIVDLSINTLKYSKNFANKKENACSGDWFVV